MKLSSGRITALSLQPGVDTTLVENFLSSMRGLTQAEALANMERDAAAYRWTTATGRAIQLGIMEATIEDAEPSSNPDTSPQRAFHAVETDRFAEWRKYYASAWDAVVHAYPHLHSDPRQLVEIALRLADAADDARQERVDKGRE